jgi:hypothetical protein
VGPAGAWSLELKPKAHLDGEKQGSCGEEAFFSLEKAAGRAIVRVYSVQIRIFILYRDIVRTSTYYTVLHSHRYNTRTIFWGILRL